MAESHIPDDMGGDEAPFEVDPDLIDNVDSVDDDGGIARPEPKPEKRRGRPPKHPPQPGDDVRRRAFVESNVKTSLAKQDMMEVINRYDWESGDYDVSILRVQPQTWHGRNIQGYIAAFPHAIDENFISENFGGGVYDLKIRGPNPRAGGAAKGFLDGSRVKISGEPKISPMDKSIAFDGGGIMLNEPQAGPPSMRQMTSIRGQGEQRRIIMGGDQGSSTDQDPSLIKMSFNSMMEREKQSSREAANLRERLIEQKQGGGDSVTKEAMRIIKESADRAIDAERSAAEKMQEAESRHREDFEKMVDRMNNQKAGIPPEMLQTLTEQHRSELAAVQESRLTQLSQAQERHERDVTNLRERYEREISVLQERSQESLGQVRAELQTRLDRQEEQYRREMERERERYQAELVRLKEDADKRYSDLDREHKSRFDRAQEDLQRRMDQMTSQGVSERDALSRSHQMNIEHMKALHSTQIDQISATLKGQIEQERSQRDSLMVQSKAQHESSVAQLTANYDAQLRMMETSYRSQIENLSSELGRTRSDLDSTRAKVTEQGDLASQAQKLKMIGDSLQGVFGLGGSAGALARLGDDVDVEQRQEEPKTWFGKLMQFANSDMGAGVFDFMKTAVGAAAVGVYPGGSMPGMVPGYAPPQGYGPPPGYGPPQGYAPPSPYVAPYPQPQVQSRPYSPVNQENPEDEFVEEGEEGDAEGSFVDDGGQEAEPARAAPESPRVQAASQSPVRPEATNVSQIPPEAVEQMKVLVKGLEESMNNGVSPQVLAQGISKMAPPDQLRPLVDTPLAQLIGEISAVLPGSPLATYQGKKFVGALQQELRKIIG
jgi:hypothetical protein